MKAVFLDYKDINMGDLSWEPFTNICELEAYYDSTPEEAIERCADAEAVLIDSCKLDSSFMDACPKLRYIGCVATGYNNVDIDYAKARNIRVTNVPAYSTDAVAQHTIALLLKLTNLVGHTPSEIGEIPTLLAGKTMGIVGYGNIGKKVAEIAQALGMKVNIYSRDPEAAIASDVVSLHCPLNDETRGMVDGDFISRMKDGAIFINTARGGLVEENALAEALRSGKIRAAGLDVLAKEPPEDDCPLLELENCLITPHMAFAPKETREEVARIAAENLASFLAGGNANVI
ncbi:MAG: D-2-hydroxyacid dehydrogenase [Bacillota bacterium]|nr:D-2-hydroxyacid dehydrogenase [Bacillota bacterium]